MESSLIRKVGKTNILKKMDNVINFAKTEKDLGVILRVEKVLGTPWRPQYDYPIVTIFFHFKLNNYSFKI